MLVNLQEAYLKSLTAIEDYYSGKSRANRARDKLLRGIEPSFSRFSFDVKGRKGVSLDLVCDPNEQKVWYDLGIPFLLANKGQSRKYYLLGCFSNGYDGLCSVLSDHMTCIKRNVIQTYGNLEIAFYCTVGGRFLAGAIGGGIVFLYKVGTRNDIVINNMIFCGDSIKVCFNNTWYNISLSDYAVNISVLREVSRYAV